MILYKETALLLGTTVKSNKASLL